MILEQNQKKKLKKNKIDFGEIIIEAAEKSSTPEILNLAVMADDDNINKKHMTLREYAKNYGDLLMLQLLLKSNEKNN